MKKPDAFHVRDHTSTLTVSFLMLFLATISQAGQEPNKTVWEGVFTKDQALRGRDAYTQQCSYCHGTSLHGGEVAGELAPDLKGAIFLLRFGGSLSELFIKIDDYMPKDAPGKVTSEDTADIVAYLLESNEAPSGDSELPADREKVKGLLVTRKPAN